METFLDLAKLKMWDPLQSLLVSQNSSDEIKVQTLWIIGTAVQNNPSAQNSVRVSLRHAANSWKSNPALVPCPRPGAGCVIVPFAGGSIRPA